jgi:hypothetical protein
VKPNTPLGLDQVNVLLLLFLKKQPGQTPGQLFYPAEYSHVFEKYWDHLANPEDHTEFCQESEFTQGCMKHFSSALSSPDMWELHRSSAVTAPSGSALF